MSYFFLSGVLMVWTLWSPGVTGNRERGNMEWPIQIASKFELGVPLLLEM